MKTSIHTYRSAPETNQRRSKTVESSKIYGQEIFLEPKLLELVRLRVAQLCQCQLCVDYHTENLKAQGELSARIEQLSSWRSSELYSIRERIALEVGEALGSDPPIPLAKEMVRAARAHFNDAEILQLTLTIFAVNDWTHLCAH